MRSGAKRVPQPVQRVVKSFGSRLKPAIISVGGQFPPAGRADALRLVPLPAQRLDELYAKRELMLLRRFLRHALGLFQARPATESESDHVTSFLPRRAAKQNNGFSLNEKNIRANNFALLEDHFAIVPQKSDEA